MTASVRGTFVLPLYDGSTCDIPMYYCPSLSNSTLRVQPLLLVYTMDTVSSTCRVDVAFSCHIRMIMIHPSLRCTKDDLYFIAGSTPYSSGSHVSRLATKPQLLSELWHQRLDHPGPTQLSALAKHITGLPSLLTMHPMHFCRACNNGKIQRADKGPITDTALLLPGTRFHLDFGFIRVFRWVIEWSLRTTVITHTSSLSVPRHATHGYFVKHPSRLLFSSLSAFWH
jgi:hypothetical protein